MNDPRGLMAVLLIAALSPACKRQPEQGPPTATREPAAAESPPAAPSGPKRLDACTIKMTAPESREWKTFWDPAHTRTAGANPSGVRSAHWANEAEQKSAKQMGVVIPLEVVCSSNQDAKPSIGINIVAYDSQVADVPLAPGTYRIVAKAGPRKSKPGEFIVSILIFGQAMFAGKTGTLKLERFDSEGAKGSFSIDGNEILTGSRPLHIEATFDMPCRRELLQGGCKSNKAE